MKCLCCDADLNLLGKNRKALYCNTKCKSKFNTKNNAEAIKTKQEAYRAKPTSKALQLYHAAKTRAKANNLLFELTPEWVENKIAFGFCEVTGLPFVWKVNGDKNPWGPSLDKIDPNKGYTMDNTRAVVWIYNAAKNVFSDSDVMLLATSLVNSNGSLKSQTSKRGK